MESDQYMPEYWPANRIIGKLEKALVKAENILGLIQSTQIANLAAAKVTGLLTSAQIAEIEAAKIGGKLTNAQIESIEAAKITGQIVETQIGPESISTGKIKAANITTALLAVGSVIAEKLAVGSVIAEKLAVNSVTATKIAAGAVIAEKISVATLSAIAVNAGTITAGTFEGVTFQTTAKRTIMNNEGITLLAEKKEAPNPDAEIEWKNAAGERIADVFSTIAPAAQVTTKLRSFGKGEAESSLIEIETHTKGETTVASLTLNAAITGPVATVSAAAGAAIRTVINSANESNYPQLIEKLKRFFIGGQVSAAGAKVSGDPGFTCKRNAKGDFTVEFNTELTIVPSVSATPISEAFIPQFIFSQITKKLFRFKIWNGGIAEDSAFTFLVYG
jgi:hypothetical protein